VETGLSGIMMKIDSEFHDLISPLSDEEKNQLEANILADGIRDPLVIWNDTLVDGHHRYEIAKRHNLTYRTVELNRDTRDDVMLWMIDNQGGRRNLSTYARGELGLKYLEIESRLAKDRMLAGKADPRQNSAQGSPDTNKAAERAAKTVDMSRDTLSRVKYLNEHADDETKTKLRSNETSINQEYTRLRLRENSPPLASKPHIAHNSGNNEWYTPARFIESARTVMGSIDTDPASSEVANAVVEAETYYTEETDGRDKVWNGNVWMNPPYAQPLIGDFCRGIAEQYKAGSIKQACVLVNNATETAWFSDLFSACSAVCFVRSRIRFIDQGGEESGSPLQGQAVVYCGYNASGFVDEFKAHGTCMIKPE